MNKHHDFPWDFPRNDQSVNGVFPRPGDMVAVEVEGIGRLENTWGMPSWVGDGSLP